MPALCGGGNGHERNENKILVATRITETKLRTLLDRKRASGRVLHREEHGAAPSILNVSRKGGQKQRDAAPDCRNDIRMVGCTVGAFSRIDNQVVKLRRWKLQIHRPSQRRG